MLARPRRKQACKLCVRRTDLVGVDGLNHAVRVDVRRQRQLNTESRKGQDPR